jgi:hypothetical protein
VARDSVIIAVAIAAVGVLVVPLIAMQCAEAVWGPIDYLVAVGLLLGAGLAYAFLRRKATDLAYRCGAGIAVAGTLFLVWINLVVGVIGDDRNPANLMYAGVLTVGLCGALLAQFRPGGMARALFATAFAQVVVALVVQIRGLDSPILLNWMFVVIWVGAALLFQHAAATEPA